jgi:hypothetical protein
MELHIVKEVGPTLSRPAQCEGVPVITGTMSHRADCTCQLSDGRDRCCLPGGPKSGRRTASGHIRNSQHTTNKRYFGLLTLPRVSVHDHQVAPSVGQVWLLVHPLRGAPSLCAVLPRKTGGNCTRSRHRHAGRRGAGPGVTPEEQVASGGRRTTAPNSLQHGHAPGRGPGRRGWPWRERTGKPDPRLKRFDHGSRPFSVSPLMIALTSPESADDML